MAKSPKTAADLAAELAAAEAEAKRKLDAKKAKLGLKFLALSAREAKRDQTDHADIQAAVAAALAEQAKNHAEALAELRKKHQVELTAAKSEHSKHVIRDAIIGHSVKVAIKNQIISKDVLFQMKGIVQNFTYQQTDIGWPEAQTEALRFLDGGIR